MSKTFTIKDLESLKKKGLIRDFTVTSDRSKLPPEAFTDVNTEWMKMHIRAFCIENDLLFHEEYYFHPERHWRFDFAILPGRIAIEYEGIYSAKSRHTTIEGFSGDIDKYNAAAEFKWRLLRYTAKNYRNVIQDLKQLLNL